MAIIGAAACKSHWSAEVTQPPLLLRAETAARTSAALTIVMRDMEMFEQRRGPGLFYKRLANTAYYVVVSRDRFRFHVTLRHKWEAMSDLRTWEAWVEDGRGARHEVEEVAQRMVQIGFGRVPVYRGDADFSVYARDLYAVGNRVTLVLRRPGYEYRYVWVSESDPEA
jgi:hypothetical protein